MRRSPVRAFLPAFLLALPLLAACGGGDGGDHSVSRNGVLHKDGLEDPLRNCTECHGGDLRGGRGPSCYSCHGLPASHTAIRGGISHDPAGSATCSACHGPNNTGGLGPACTTCHR